MTVWIDEFELLGGADVESELQSAVVNSCDYFIVFIDDHSVESEWVHKEIGWALARERELGRPFLLPVVVDQSALGRLATDEVARRKYLTLADFTDASIRALAQSITSEVLQWLSQYFSSNQSVTDSSAPIDTRSEFLARADQILDNAAEVIKAEVLPYREANPLSLKILAESLASAGHLDSSSSGDLVELLDRLADRHLLNGVEYDEDFIYLSQEQYSYKSTVYKLLKRKMAGRAARIVRSGMTIAIDGGSTTLELAKALARRIRQGKIDNLIVVTNSVPVAYEFAKVLSEIGAGDRDNIARVFIIAGMVRSVSLTIVPKNLDDYAEDFSRLLSEITKLDVAFMGANGVCQDLGFANHSPYEIPFKRTMIERAERKVVLVDSSKFSVEQERLFAYFSESLEVITAATPGSEGAIKRFGETLASTNSTIEVLE